jgi:DNA-binding CsgD family transcriptional regulator
MPNFQEIICDYSGKFARRISNICSPLADHLGITVFTYYFVESDGRFGYITNAVEFNDYYFSQKLHHHNPYFAHPRLFHSGYNLTPCTFDEELQKALVHRFQADHLFLCLEASETNVEGFIFANTNQNKDSWPSYVKNLDLLNKFCKYFKREVRDIIDSIKGDGFNIEKMRGSDFYRMPSKIPLTQKEDVYVASFLKKISKLSRQEERCLKLFRQGKSAQATGAIMQISQRTVESYFKSIKNKLCCSSKYDLLD